LRIAVVSPFVDRQHGTERALAELLERLARTYGWEIHLYAQSISEISAKVAGHGAIATPGIYWHRVPALPGPHLFRFVTWMLLNRIMRGWHTRFGRTTFDLVLSPGINCLDADAIIVHAVFSRLTDIGNESAGPRDTGGRFRRWHRSAYYALLARLERKVYSDPDVHLVAVSLHTAELLKAYFQRTDTDVIPNGVDTGHFSVEKRLARRTEARAKRGFRYEESVLLLIGNDWRVKGLPAVLESISALPGSSLRMLIVGGDAPGRFQSRAVELGVENLCRWEPSSEDVLDFYAAADIYVSPSREDSFGLPVLEAMACGLPVITSSCAGVAEYIHDGVDGFVMKDPADIPALSATIAKLRHEHDLCRSVGTAASATAAKLTWDRNAEATWKLLVNAARDRKPWTD
jgi:glycosyltransferase involved in cell wall biosynthesis